MTKLTKSDRNAGAYTTNGHTWSRPPVPYSVNYASTSSCSTRNRTLDADDIAGVQALYPPVPGFPPPTAPTGLRVVIVRD